MSRKLFHQRFGSLTAAQSIAQTVLVSSAAKNSELQSSHGKVKESKYLDLGLNMNKDDSAQFLETDIYFDRHGSRLHLSPKF